MALQGSTPYEVEVIKVKGKRMVHCENGAYKIARNFTISASACTHCIACLSTR